MRCCRGPRALAAAGRRPAPAPAPAAVASARRLHTAARGGSLTPRSAPRRVPAAAGPASEEGLRLRSFRIPGGLEATVTLDKNYCAFPGIMNGGIITSLFDCQGNWAAALALMDKGCLPMPPLTLTYEMLVRRVEESGGEEGGEGVAG